MTARLRGAPVGEKRVGNGRGGIGKSPGEEPESWGAGLRYRRLRVEARAAGAAVDGGGGRGTPEPRGPAGKILRCGGADPAKRKTGGSRELAAGGFEGCAESHELSTARGCTFLARAAIGEAGENPGRRLRI